MSQKASFSSEWNMCPDQVTIWHGMINITNKSDIELDNKYDMLESEFFLIKTAKLNNYVWSQLGRNSYWCCILKLVMVSILPYGNASWGDMISHYSLKFFILFFWHHNWNNTIIKIFLCYTPINMLVLLLLYNNITFLDNAVSLMYCICMYLD